MNKNRQALIDAVIAFATKMRKGKSPETQDELDRADQRTREVVLPQQSNTMMDNIADSSWGEMFENTGTVFDDTNIGITSV